ncbi:MAG: hypothetical protein J6P47_05380 [Acetobacter sp.]|nr:hypothetical protein [Acetobacter sp.]MBO6043872.1 hypothetical protein [Acetobacter sp.]MBO6090846.1 hypothetical protein [Acetobacter sp.]MBO7350959.1 hypothetical protein [Acetobacter sp.]MBQ3818423.1 hypothetical protein [Acetobacter sp.]
MKFDPRTRKFDLRKLSTYPIIRILCALVGAWLMLYCLMFYIALPADSPEHVMKHIAAVAGGAIIILCTLWM